MWRYKVRAIILTGVICVFAVWVTPVRSQDQAEADKAKIEEAKPAPTGDPKAATTTKELDIPVDELKLLVKPLTLEDLQNEAADWMLLLKTKAKEISQAEVAIKRQNQAISKQKEGSDALEEAKKELEEAEKIQGTATPGSPEYEAAAKKVEEAKEDFKKAQEAVKEAKTTKEELKQDEASRSVLEKATKTGELEKAQQTLDKMKKDREKMVAGALDYEEATKKIEKLEAAIAAIEAAQEAQKGANPDSPEYEKAIQEIDKAHEALKQVLQEMGGANTNTSSSEQSSESLNKATATLEDTQIKSNGEEKVAGSPEVVNNQQNLQQKQQQLEKTTEQLEKSAEAESDAKNQLVVTVTELQSQLSAIVVRFNVILDELEKKGGKAESYRQYVKAVSSVELDAKDTEGLGLRLLGWFQSEEGGMRWTGNTIKFIGVLVISIIVSQILGTILSRVLSLFSGTSVLMRSFTVMLVKRGGIVVGLLLALTALEVSLGPILALLGGVSFVLAFALQSNLGNLASGLMIMAYKPFDVGDEVKLAGIWGFVDSITLANTKIKGFGGQLFTIPNNTVWGDTIENLSQGEIRQIRLLLRIGFDENLARVEQLLLEILQTQPQIVEDPGPRTSVGSIEDYYISVSATGWASAKDHWRVQADIIRTIRERFYKEGIKLAAVPVQDVRLQQPSNNGKGKNPPLISQIPVHREADSVSEPPPDLLEEMELDEAEVK